jgi:CDP-diacylglycerol--serine O-phosphatidyltransferase
MSKSILEFIKLKDIVTLTGTVFGVLALMFGILVKDLPLGFFLMLLGVGTDLLDGFVARKLNQANEIGIQIDSLNDFFVFGVVPAILIFTGYVDDLPLEIIFYVPACIIFVLGALLRLARFNITTESAKGYTGLVTPLSAIMICNAFFSDFFAIRAFGENNPYSVFMGFFFPFLLVIMAYCNITVHIEYGEKTKKKGGKLKYLIIALGVATPVIGLIGLGLEGYYDTLPTPPPSLLLAMAILYGIFLGFLIGESIYILLGFKNYLVSRKARKAEPE